MKHGKLSCYVILDISGRNTNRISSMEYLLPFEYFAAEQKWLHFFFISYQLFGKLNLLKFFKSLKVLPDLWTYTKCKRIFSNIFSYIYNWGPNWQNTFQFSKSMIWTYGDRRLGYSFLISLTSRCCWRLGADIRQS